MAKFCGKCGTKLNEKTGLCPQCEKKNKKKGKKKLLKTFILIVIIALLGFSTMCILTYFDIINVSAINELFYSMQIKDRYDIEWDDDYKVPEEYIPPSIDADAFFEEKSDVISVVSANESDEVRTEAEIYQNFKERGFTNNPITTECSMDGEYFDEEEISESSTDIHPIYETSYFSKNGITWLIYEINGKIMANPLSYNWDSSRQGAQVYVSETKTLMSFDSATQKFYETIPYENIIKVKSVEKIDSKTLESITIEDLGNF